MRSFNTKRFTSRAWVGGLGLSVALALGALPVAAQTSGEGASGPSGPARGSNVGTLNCAVTTATYGSQQATLIFGLPTDPSGFNSLFQASDQGAGGGRARFLAQRCIRLEVENPDPGTDIPPGLIINGFAFDPLASPDQGAGISQIQVFLGDPNQGGQMIGQAGAGTPTITTNANNQLGMSDARGARFGPQFANAGFNVLAQVPCQATGNPATLFVSAVSMNGGRVGTVGIPVTVQRLLAGTSAQGCPR